MQDPILLAIKAAVVIGAVVLVVLASRWIHQEQAVASLHCPPPDHAMWAASIDKAICGESFSAGFKAVKAK